VQVFHHLRSSDARSFGMVDATGFKIWRRSHLQRRDLSNEFHEILVGSKFTGGGQETGGQTNIMVIS
jgi:hypothetical protein